MNGRERIDIPSESIGSIPRPEELIETQHRFRQGKLGGELLNDYYLRGVQTTIRELEATGSKIITDGEQAKPSFLTYPIFKLIDECYTFSLDCYSLKSVDGQHRALPRLIKAPFRYATYASTYIDVAKQFTKLPIKQTVISPSALTMVYPIPTIQGYSHEQFLTDLINESEKDIRLCLEKGADCVQIDFTEACFCLKADPGGQLLRDFIRFNNRVLQRFVFEEQHRLGVHVCLGIHKDYYLSAENGYLRILPILFELHVGKFYLQLAREHNREQVLVCIHKYMHPWQRIFIGVIDPLDPEVETPEEVCSRILEAANYIPVEQLGTTDDCGFSPFADDQSVTRRIAFRKIKARIKGTHMAEEQLMLQRQRKN